MTAPGGEPTPDAWRRVDPRAAAELIDARLQTHHAAQLAAALGVSYLATQPDDSHTNLEWLAGIGALASQPVRGPSSTIRLAVRPHVFALLVLGENNATLATCPLNGRTRDGALRWVRGQLAAYGLDPAAYVLPAHYTIPAHAVAESAPFNATAPARFEELASWFADAALALGALATSMPNASPVRCWPHHFDMATLIELAPAVGGAPSKTVGAGMEPGDQYYREPYFYVNMNPAPPMEHARPRLGGDGIWHTTDWLGAVLPASRVVAGRGGAGGGQRSQVDEFIGSAVHACIRLLMKG